jgi:transcription elongation GreA/GreB family factor
MMAARVAEVSDVWEGAASAAVAEHPTGASSPSYARSMVDPTKASLRDELLERLRGDLQAAENAHRTTQEGATHEEAKPENDKDTRALEQSYLARGQAARAVELRAAIAAVTAFPTRENEEEQVAPGAFVRLAEDGSEWAVWIAPAGGGARLARGEVQVITPASPLGRALIGKRVGDEVELRLAGKVRRIEVSRIG